jgi:hypothetical protein
VGNLHLRFDEGGVGRGFRRPLSYLYWLRTEPRALASGMYPDFQTERQGPDRKRLNNRAAKVPTMEATILTIANR